MTMKSKAVLFLFISLLFTMPSFGQKNNKNKFDEEQGSKGAQMVIEQMGLVDDEKMTKYINDIGQRLVEQIENRQFEYHFYLVDMVEPNAFALPGGYIYISRGLITIAQTEDELAGVIGHEITHVSQRHSYKQTKKSIFPSLLMVPGALAGMVNEQFGALINAPIAAASKLRLASYGRKQETEADNYGIELAAKAGYDPAQLANILQRISKEVEFLTGKEESFSYFDSHPFTPDRVTNIQEKAPGLEIADTPHFVKTNESFARMFDGMYITDNPEQGVFVKNSFYQADIGIAFDIPDGWNGVNKPTFVGATDSAGRAQLILGVVNSDATTDELSSTFVENFKKQYQIESYKLKDIEFNGYKGHLFAIDEYNRGDPVNYTIAWFTNGNGTFQMICYGQKKFEKSFNESITSFHTITPEEKNKVTGLVLRVAVAKEETQLEDFGKQNNNRLTPEFTALINAIDEKDPVKSGQFIKIGVVEKYIPKSN